MASEQKSGIDLRMRSCGGLRDVERSRKSLERRLHLADSTILSTCLDSYNLNCNLAFFGANQKPSL